MEKGIVYIDGIKNVNTKIIQNSTSLTGISKVDNSNTEAFLSLGVIDKTKEPMYKSVELILCKPNKEEIAILSDAYDRELDTMFVDIDELRFNIPYYIEKQYEQVVNPNWDLIKENYLVKIGNKYFTIESTSIDGDTVKEVKSVQCYSLEYQLAKRNLRGMQGTRQLYKGVNDGTVVNISYSVDGLTWGVYSTPFEIMDDVTVYFKTLDKDNFVLNSFTWNANNKVNETQGVTINSTLVNITQGSVAKKLLITARIISEIGEGILNILEKETTWRVGYIDSTVREDTSMGQNHRRYRTFDISEKAWLEVIRDDIQKAFGCYVFFDTDKKELNIYNALTYKNNKGLYISEENYIKSIKKDVKDTEIITRLHVYGKDNKSIATINPTGQTYIENLDHYRNIKYMPQDLLVAMDLYFGSLDGSTIGLLGSKSGVFSQLYKELQDLRVKQLKLENERAELQTKYKIADNEVDYAIQSHNKDNTLPTITVGVGGNSEDISQSIIQILSDVNVPRDLSTLNTARDLAKQAVDAKDVEIAKNETAIQNKLGKITDLKNLLAKDRKTSMVFEGITYPINFTLAQINLLDEFIKESTWQKDIYVDFYNAYELLSEGMIALDKLSKPRVEIEVDVIDLLNIVECQRDWGKLEIGDMVNIFYDRLDISIESRLIKISHNIDNNSLSITISTDDEIDDPTKYLSQIAGSASDASNSIDMSKSNWDLSMVNQDQISQIISSSLDTAKNRVLSGRNQNIVLDERGIAMRDMFDNNEQLRMLNNVIAFTKDNWATCSTAISPMGVIAQELYGKIVGSNRLIITNMNDSGESSFLVDKNHMKAINMDLSLLNKSQLNRIYLNPEIGIKIQKKVAGSWSDILWLGMDGDVYAQSFNIINNNTRLDDKGLIVDNGKIIIVNANKYDAVYADETGEMRLDGRLRVIRHLNAWTPVDAWDKEPESNRVILLDAYKDENKGGKIAINDWAGKPNVFIGSSPSSLYQGGFLKIYGSGVNERIDMGVLTSNNTGVIRIKNDLNNNIVSLLGNDAGGEIAINSKNGGNIVGILGDDKGGLIIVNSSKSNLETNIVMGCLENDNLLDGGFLKICNKGINKERVFIGIKKANDAGSIELKASQQKVKVSLSAMDMDNNSISSGVIKLFDVNDTPTFLMYAQTPLTVSGRENSQDSALIMGKDKEHAKIGMYGGGDNTGALLELASAGVNSYGNFPNMSLGDLSNNGSSFGGSLVIYKNMSANTHEERVQQRRIHFYVNGENDGEIDMYDSTSSTDPTGKILAKNGEFTVVHKSGSKVRFSADGKIYLN